MNLSSSVLAQKGEDWRYTSLKGFDWERAPRALRNAAKLAHPAMALGEGEDALLVVDPAFGGATSAIRDAGDWAATGARLTSIAESGEQILDRLPAGFANDPFAGWVSAHFQDGAYLRVPEGRAVRGVIRILYVFREEAETAFFRVFFTSRTARTRKSSKSGSRSPRPNTRRVSPPSTLR